ncbi:MAG TPA: RnfABCDGE type electron transport complex subunit B [Kiritimatiellia bacterium]|nr:RnfABCDGE type electron transport complex subunit B [Kiritimatiellia bacterium]HRZ12741.1 RnfABCDGE type electron transport complex subunit B [Kiritimatiellia bacterium]HSA18307.1 RnfABCDGE type electron transport complex subunit B [Kiritimatiellia bacterium]
MDPMIMLLAGGTMLVMAIVAGYTLGWANKVFHVAVDPRIEAINAALPGANCGGCGCVGCMSYAEAVAGGKIAPDKCTVGGSSCAQAIAKIMGVDLKPSWPYRPVVHCRAHYAERLGRADYRGEKTCTGANLVGGVQGCTYGCLGFGDCVAACNYDAIHVVDGLATVDYDKCIGCGACEKACPRHIISMTPFKSQRIIAVGCSNQDMGKDVKAVCKIGCVGCMACSKASPIFKMTEGKIPRINYDEYDPENMDATLLAVKKCPVKNLIYVGKPSPEHVEAVKDQEKPKIVQVDFKTTVDQAEWRG